MLKRSRQQQFNESLSDVVYRYRGVILVISVPLLLICFVLLLMPSGGNQSDAVFPSNRKFLPRHHPPPPSNSYAVIFDAGSSGSRVHVYCFDQNLDLVPIGDELEIFVELKPGLSNYAKDPEAAAASLLPLLGKAEKVVPQDMRPNTPVKVGATAGLRQLGFDESEKILRAVKDMLKDKSSLKSADNWVAVLDGNQEAAYQWVSVNYLLKELGKTYRDTVGVVDLGGGSVQMAYAISEEEAAKAPSPSNGEDAYITEMLLMGTKYYVYVHSYLHYGLLAARAKILEASKDSSNPCVVSGYTGVYAYGGNDYKASAPSDGPSVTKCREEVVKALKVNETRCNYKTCSFGGIWDGGGGKGMKHMYVASFFYDRAAQAGIIDVTKPVAKVRPVDFQGAAERVCSTRYRDIKTIYPRVHHSNVPFLCMDLVYQFSLLVDAFHLHPWEEVTLVKKIRYNDSLVEAAWPLGSAIEAVSVLAAP